ncbi:hypothetical protein Q8W71_31235 [Methylobacterium sp. NEAU 140]|uniref:hypothetical protein n=1 Tax=Methylobacterium sp. NEAU 140 TaxID=3064945 RepID=UPI002735A5A3|nr:hypothetical protein [Methylobacterium sp. NEAU 140]MDP4026835.1 hypothetical protein [Methylobacterium sp. NEAU 140]MDP4026986.1 hypothetical protein [Methylobacterium sp. NEAU 140]MDP4027066.1 hypothetical protein [Methylobacterium sp. NEAU 140]
MHPFRWLGRLLSGVGHIATRAVIGSVALFSVVLDLLLGIVARLYDRFDAEWARMAREADERRTRDGRGVIDPITLDRNR